MTVWAAVRPVPATDRRPTRDTAPMGGSAQYSDKQLREPVGAPALDTSGGVPMDPSAASLRPLVHDHLEWEERCAALLAQVADVVR